MQYIEALLWLSTWPLVIYVSYITIKYNLKKLKD